MWARIRDLFSKTPVELIEDPLFKFDMSIAQFWIFFALAYVGFALVMGGKWVRYINALYVSVVAFFIISPEAAEGIIFWLLLALGYFAYAIIYDRQKMRSAYLLFFSLFFYWKVGSPFLFILLFSTIIDFFLGKAVHKAATKLGKKIFIALSMCTNLAVLAYFKYFKFFASEWNSMILEKDLPNWMYIWHSRDNAIGIWLNGNLTGDLFIESLPMVVGISFFTFQTMSYSIDIYRGHIKPLNNIIDFGFFVSFFPQLVAGPIVRASEFVPQIHQEYKLTKDDFGWSIYMILKGLMKKMIFADFLAWYFLDNVFEAPGEYSGMAQLIAIFGYSLQIYGDFAGYTDMAIGIAKLMGFQLPKNFNSPYKAIHCGEFWKRWHLTLSSWLKDYLYIPLGGNRGGTAGSYIVAALIISGVLYAIGIWEVTVIVCAVIAVMGVLSWYFEAFANHINRNINITLTMLLGGLWHGASWQFVIWGGLNGVGVLSTKYWLRFKSYHKVITALIVAGIIYLIKISSGAEIWLIGVWWALTVAVISLIKTGYDSMGEGKGAYANIIHIILLVIAFAGMLGGDALGSPAFQSVSTAAFIILAILMIVRLIFWSQDGTRWKFPYYSNVMWGMVHTLFFITFTRVYFRGESMEKIKIFYHQLMNDFRWEFGEKWLYASTKTTEFLDYGWGFLLLIGLGYLIHWVPTIYKKKIEGTFIKSHVGLQLLAVVVVGVLCYQAYSEDAPAFIYFQF